MAMVPCLLCYQPACIVIGKIHIPGEEEDKLFHITTKIEQTLRNHPRFCGSCFEKFGQNIERKFLLTQAMRELVFEFYFRVAE